MLQTTRSLSSMVRIQKARTTLLLDHPFFGTLLFRLGARARSSIATMATDGVSLYFNPGFVDSLNSAELIGVLAHETMHPLCSTTRAAADVKQTVGIWRAITPSTRFSSMPASRCRRTRCLMTVFAV